MLPKTSSAHLGRKEVVVLTSVTFGLLYVILAWCRKKGKKEKKFPTFPGGSFFVGHLPELLKEPGRNWGTLSRRFCNQVNSPAGYFRLFLGQKVLIMTSYDVAKEVFVLNGNVSSGRPEHFIRDIHMANRVKNAIATSDGPNWKNNRKVFHNQLRAFSKDRLFQIIQTEAGYLTDALEAACVGGAAGVGVEPSDLLQKAVSNITCTLLFGSRCDYEDEEFTQALHALVKYNTLHKPYIPYFILVLNKYINIFGWLTEKERNMNIVREFCRKRVMERIELKKEGVASEDMMVDGYLAELIKGSADGETNMDVNDVVSIIFELFFAGTETTSTTMLWAMEYLSAYPEIQSRIQNDIDCVVGRDSLIPEASIKSLHFFQATQFEIQRYACIALLTIVHRMTDDLTLSTGETLSKNERVTGIIHCLNRDPKYWKHPEEFNPDNFLNDKGEFVKNEAFFPYGQGPRVCLGEKIADLELKLFLLSILQKLDISCSEPIDTSVRISGLTSSPEKHLYSFTKRA